ncbi:Spx/MgsR family RNA polymerase-binding regulatory protein [Alicyclobacillus fastidiosus]|uniref:Spx/MgsR family RNA polymerase-binding regulatory protein n=1 Tax=Alicyclobacillus fastidiosus TaxID=392011 RepID=A0ABY6ZDY3_9BACL|nr:Spx/MgsR family RNA polymerase-binding regulatory protein [Alicyclobacillus fastidiosus]WAH40773.1 Spx/MgsR family RNA polymerase-binding regulatory protein [Alicyclobacillus fastidiosus]GMA62248.1 arsenate reductase [Alicyclobacillus fastidiosus]
MLLYGYKRCSTCRDAHKTLQESGANVQFHDIVDRPPSEQTIRTWMERSGRPVEDFVNTRGTVYRERDLKHAKFTEDEWIRELSKDGKLLKRPILETDKEVFVGYHEGAYRRIALGEDQ